MASKCGPRWPHWFGANGMKRYVAECCRSSGLRRSLENFLFYVVRRAKSELEDESNKQYFEIEEQITTSIAASFAWRPPATAYRSPGREASLCTCLASRMNWMGGIAMPPDHGCIAQGVLSPISALHAFACVSHPLCISLCVIAIIKGACTKALAEEGLSGQCCRQGMHPAVSQIEWHHSRRAVRIQMM